MLQMINSNKLFNKLVRKLKFSHFCVSPCTKDAGCYDGRVYNLSISGDETYMANGFAVHNCRSTTDPSIKPEFAADKKPGGSSRPSSADFGVWLKNQPAGFQDEYFSKFTDGAEKARLFRIGKLPIDRFGDELGAEYSLDQLRALNPVAFQKAGIEPNL